METEKKMTPEELSGKLEWEGGSLYDLATSYGIKPDDLEDGPLKDVYKIFYQEAAKLAHLETQVLKHIPDIEDDL